MLSVRNVTFKYGKTPALSDVSFDVAAGQAVLVVGGSGAGKSALLDCIAGISAFDGSISVGGFGCRSFQARRSVGYVRDPLSSASSSGRVIYDKLSCDENLAFVRRAYALDADGVKYASSLLASFGLDRYRLCPVGELSASARRRFEIVMALAVRPSLLLLDRPALGLEKVYADELCACLLALKLRGTAVVIAVSDVSEIGAVWDAGYELKGGRIVGSFAPVAADVSADGAAPCETAKTVDVSAVTVDLGESAADASAAENGADIPDAPAESSDASEDDTAVVVDDAADVSVSVESAAGSDAAETAADDVSDGAAKAEAVPGKTEAVL